MDLSLSLSLALTPLSHQEVGKILLIPRGCWEVYRRSCKSGMHLSILWQRVGAQYMLTVVMTFTVTVRTTQLHPYPPPRGSQSKSTEARAHPWLGYLKL